jgi:hypothetical protein
MPRLKVTNSDLERIEYDFGHQRVTLGREADNLIVIDDNTCSRHHAVIEKSGGAWWLRDLKSTHGTLHKGSKIKNLKLEDGTVFEIGARKFQFFLKPAGKARAGQGVSLAKAAAKEAAARTGRNHEKDEGTVAARADPSKRPAVAGATAPPSATSAFTGQNSVRLRHIRRKRLVSTLLVVLASALGFKLVWKAVTQYSSENTLQPAAIQEKVEPLKPLQPASPPVSVASAERVLSRPEILQPRQGEKTKEVMKSQPSPGESAAAGKQEQAKMEPEDETRKVLYAPDGKSAGFQPVLSPGLDSVLHVRASADMPWMDVFLNEKRILEQVKIVSESQMRFSEDGSTWAVQAEDKEGRSFIALTDRRIPLEGKVALWLGNSNFSHVAAVVRRNEEDHLHVDGEWRTSYHHIRDVRLSEDGRKWACVVSRMDPSTPAASAGERVLTHDDSGAVCERVLSLQMDSDGARVLWLAEHRGGRTALMAGDACLCEVIAGKGEQIQSPVLSKTGGRIAWAVVSDNAEPRFYLEGQEPVILPVQNAPTDSSSHASILSRPHPATRILFSKDGRHVVFAALGKTSAVVHDGDVCVRGPVLQLDSLTLSEDGLKVGCVLLEALEKALPGTAQLHRATLHVTGMQSKTETKVWARGKSPDSTMIVGGISGLRFSPNHQKLAWIRSVPIPDEKRYVRQVWVGDERVETPHENVIAFFWKSPQILVLADMPLSSDAIAQVFHRFSPVKQP